MKRVVLLLFSVLLFSYPESVRSKGKNPRPPGKPVAEVSQPILIPAATLSVSFGRQSLRENDWVPVEVWISNTSDQPLQNLRLEISAPKFTHWYAQGSCSQTEIHSLTDDQIPAHKTVPHKLCLGTDNEIEVGEFNTLFSLTYEWTVNGVVKQSFVTNEKTIKVNLFGSESVAGVPLALAGFLVPGLIFWIFVRLWKVPWDQEATKELIYSVLISVAVIGLGYTLQNVADWRWLKYLDIRNGISATKLFALATTGMVLGNIVGFVYFAWMRWKMAKIISPPDPLITKVLKIVNQNSKSLNPSTTIRVQNPAATYVGSLAATSQGTVWLIGWFKLDIRPYAKDQEFVKKIKDSLGKGNVAKVLRMARRKKMQLEDNSQIMIGDQPQGDLLNWKEAELSGQPQKREERTVKPLLELVE
jgi:hypothetical protein